MPNESATFLYVGTYTKLHRSPVDSEAVGISAFRLDPSSGALTAAGLTPALSPSWLALHPSRRFLYAVNEVGETNGYPSGFVSAYAVDQATGAVAHLNTVEVGAPGPCHVAIEQTGQYAIVASYLGGTVAMFPIADSGRLGAATDVHHHVGSSVDPERQMHAFAHSANLDPANRFVFVADLGIDKVMAYELDLERGKLVPRDDLTVSVTPGFGPRHMVFHPNGRVAYLLTEMGGTVIVFTYDAARGALTEIQTIRTLPDDYPGKVSTAELVIHPAGRFLYASNRVHDSIAIFAVDAETGRLSLLGHESTQGETARNFTIHPDGALLYAANQRSNTIVGFRIDGETGALTPTGQATPTPVPVCLLIATLTD